MLFKTLLNKTIKIKKNPKPNPYTCCEAQRSERIKTPVLNTGELKDFT